MSIMLHVLFWYGLPLAVLALIVLLAVDGARSSDEEATPWHSKYRALAITGICIGTLVAFGVGSIPLFERGGPSLDADWLKGLGLIAILMLPAFLAIAGLRRPGALLAAGVVSAPLFLMSFSLFLFPMLIPTALYFAAYGEAPISFTPRLAPSAIACLTFVLLVLSFLSLFMNEDPRCYEIVKRGNGTTFERSIPADEGSSVLSSSGGVIESGCSSDTVTPIETGLSLSFVTLAVTSATYLSGPRRSARVPLDIPT